MYQRIIEAESGLTHHKFQMQCRIRKAQELLREGYKVTDGAYSFHLVRIAPECSINDHIHVPQLETHEVIAGYGRCVNGGTEIEYRPGVISIMPSGVHHEVHAGEEGLYLFAKFMPALC